MAVAKIRHGAWWGASVYENYEIHWGQRLLIPKICQHGLRLRRTAVGEQSPPEAGGNRTISHGFWVTLLLRCRPGSEGPMKAQRHWEWPWPEIPTSAAFICWPGLRFIGFRVWSQRCSAALALESAGKAIPAAPGLRAQVL